MRCARPRLQCLPRRFDRHYVLAGLRLPNSRVVASRLWRDFPKMAPRLSEPYRRAQFDPASARIVLVDMAPKVLGPFSESLSKAAKQRLENLGVEVRLGHSVDQIDAEGIVIAGERIACKTVIWTAGVAPSPAGKWLNVETDRAGRVRVQPDVSVPGHPEIFVVGDTASLAENGKPLPAVSQVALQQGTYAGQLIHKSIERVPS